VRGYAGLTLYARLGNVPAVLLALLAGLPALFARRRSR
jgi:apolipoprotein N-acyltransferase